MNKTLDQMADAVILGVRGYVDKQAVARIQGLEERIRDLEERLRAVDGQKAHIRNFGAPIGYIRKVM